MDIAITDLDGTLLDLATYSFAAAEPGMALLERKGVPLVFCTSKTRSEVEHWRELTGNRHPFIVENGGAVFAPEAYFDFPIAGAERRDGYWVLVLGAPYAELVGALLDASAKSGCAVRGFHQMSVAQVAEACGLPAEIAALAKKREFDEPFTVGDAERAGPLTAAIEAAGKRWTRGDRFYHIDGDNDKAAAVRLLVDLYRRIDPGLRTIGLGDGLNDVEFLRIVDVPVLVRSPSFEKLRAAVPAGRPTESCGPRGWNEAVLELYG